MYSTAVLARIGGGGERGNLGNDRKKTFFSVRCSLTSFQISVKVSSVLMWTQNIWIATTVKLMTGNTSDGNRPT